MIPTPEQQAATALKYCPVEPEPTQVIRPTVVEEPTNWRQTLSLWVIRFCLVTFVVGVVLNITNHPQHSFWTTTPTGLITGGTALWAGALFFLFVYGLIAFWFCAIRFSWHLGKDAARPCPTPAEIEQELRARGYNPSLQDVLAVHAAAKREQYENIGLAVGWFALMDHVGHESYQAMRTGLG